MCSITGTHRLLLSHPILTSVVIIAEFFLSRNSATMTLTTPVGSDQRWFSGLAFGSFWKCFWLSYQSGRCCCPLMGHSCFWVHRKNELDLKCMSVGGGQVPSQPTYWIVRSKRLVSLWGGSAGQSVGLTPEFGSERTCKNLDASGTCL